MTKEGNFYLMRKALLLSFLPLLGFSLLSYFLQTEIFIKDDVTYFLHAGMSLLQGRGYEQAFFEMNPPLIIYIYLPVIFFSKITTLGLIASVRIYILALSGISILLSSYLLAQYFSCRNRSYYILMYAMIFILLFLPGSEFAQREHLLLIFTQPYWFLAALRIKDAQPINPYLALVVGLFAFFGFALKPFFLFPLLLLELSLMFTKRKLFFWLRAETMALFSLGVLYGALVVTLHKDYLSVIMPIAMRYYFVNTVQPWSDILSASTVLYCFFAMFVYLINRKQCHHKILLNILFIALLGFSVAFLVTKTNWYYHVLPALGMACLLLALQVGDLAFSPQVSYKSFISSLGDSLLVSLMAIMMFMLPVATTYIIFKHAMHDKNDQTLNELIKFVNINFHDQPIYCFPLFYPACTVSRDYANVNYASRFASFWGTTGLLKLLHGGGQLTSKQQLLKDQDFLLNLVATDFYQSKAKIVILDRSETKNKFEYHFNYIKYFSQNALFRETWKQYRYLRSFGAYEIYTPILLADK